MKVVQHVYHTSHKELDLRISSCHKEFSYQKFEFGLVHANKNMTTQGTGSPREVKHKHDEAREIIETSLNELHRRVFQTAHCSIIHFYMSCEGMDQTFIFTGVGPKRKTLKQLRYGNELDEIIDKFAQMIQSGRNLSFDDHTNDTVR